LHPAYVRLVTIYGEAAVASAGLEVFGFPADWILSVGEARKLERALSTLKVPHG